MEEAVFDLEMRMEQHLESVNEEPEFLGGVNEQASAEANPKSLERQRDLLLVEVYKQAAQQYGERSEQASEAFAPIFERFWPQVHYRAISKIGAVYADDLASETLKTVWERLNGHEVVTNLAGLVRHSFEREYATLLEKLFQGRKLARYQNITDADGETVKVRGALVVSLNAPIGTESDELELIHTLDDPNANVEDAAARRELVVMLRGLISQMPAHYRGPLVCQWLLGMKIKDVAEELNMTLDQVKHNTRRGMDWLLRKMPSQADDWL